jgi:hypothetical protein
MTFGRRKGKFVQVHNEGSAKAKFEDFVALLSRPELCLLSQPEGNRDCTLDLAFGYALHGG